MARSVAVALRASPLRRIDFAIRARRNSGATIHHGPHPFQSGAAEPYCQIREDYLNSTRLPVRSWLPFPWGRFDRILA